MRRLAGRRGGEAVALLCELLAGDAAVIVIDARGVLEDLISRVARLSPDSAPGVHEYVRERSAADRWREALNDRQDAYEAEWIEESVTEPISPGSAATQDVVTMRHLDSGERLGVWEWGERCEAVALARLVADGFPAEEPEEPSVFGESEAEDC